MRYSSLLRFAHHEFHEVDTDSTDCSLGNTLPAQDALANPRYSIHEVNHGDAAMAWLILSQRPLVVERYWPSGR